LHCINFAFIIIIGYGWYTNFLKRHGEISIRTPELVTKSSGAIKKEDIECWFRKVLNNLAANNHLDILADPDRVLNGDETFVPLHPEPQTGALAIRGSRNVYEIEHAPSKQNVTLMFSFTASGYIVDPMIVLPYTNNVPLEIARTIPGAWGIGKSSTGWMTGELFHSYLENTLYPYLTQRNVKFPVIYFVDGHASHCTYEVSLVCARLQIILICLYPNATRILQPADVAIFKPLKSCWKRMIRTWRSENLGKTFTLKELGPSLSKIMSDGFVSTNTIKNGFRACGLFPFNSQAIDYSKCLTTRENDQLIEENLNEPDVIRSVNMITDDKTDFKSQLINLIGSKRIEAHKNGQPCTGNDAENVLWNVIDFIIAKEDKDDVFAKEDVNANGVFVNDDVYADDVIAEDVPNSEDVLFSEDVPILDDTEFDANLYFERASPDIDYFTIDTEITNILKKYDTGKVVQCDDELYSTTNPNYGENLDVSTNTEAQCTIISDSEYIQTVSPTIYEDLFGDDTPDTMDNIASYQFTTLLESPTTSTIVTEIPAARPNDDSPLAETEKVCFDNFTYFVNIPRKKNTKYLDLKLNNDNTYLILK
jgi:hypothetical protein